MSAAPPSPVPLDAPIPGRTPGEPARTFDELWGTPPGVAGLTGVSHRTVGARFIVTGFAFFLVGGILALLIRLQLLVPDGALLTDAAYNQVFTMHGTVMMFLFATPIVLGTGIYLLPVMLGARDLAFPRLGVYGYYCYLLGGLVLLSSFLFGHAPDGGWFLYTPLSSKSFTPGLSADFWLIGVTFAEIASIAGAIEIVVSVLTVRAAGMSLARMPIFAWYMLAAAFMVVVGFPPLVMASIMLETERLLGLPFFDATRGGDPVLWAHLFWIFGHPEVYIVFLPGVGVIATVLPTFVGKPLVGYRWIVAAIVATTFVSFGLWVHHMYTIGLPMLSLAYFSGASMAVAIPTGIQMFAFVATLAQGRPRLEPPMLFVIAFFFVFVLGGLTGVMVASAPFDWQAHDTYFVVAHLHYVLIGGMVFPLLAGAYYWIPHRTGRLLSRRGGFATFWLTFIGFNVTFLPMHLTGFIGMPRRVSVYPDLPGWQMLNVLQTVGAFMFAAGILVFLLDVLWSSRRGRPAGRDPWRAGTLEWLHSLPMQNYNFPRIPVVHGREPLWDQPELRVAAEPEGRGVLPVVNDGRRETLAVHPVTGEPLQVYGLPRPSWWPVAAALGTAVVFVAILASQYWLIGPAAAATLLAFVLWFWRAADRGAPASKDVGGGLVLPVNEVSRRSPVWFGTGGALLVVLTLWASLVFGYYYLWTARIDFQIRAEPLADGALAVAALGAVLLFGLAMLGARRPPRAGGTLLAGAVALVSLATAAALVAAPGTLAARQTAHDATVWMLCCLVAAFLVVQVVWSGITAARGLGADRAGHAQRLAILCGADFARVLALLVLATVAIVRFSPALLGAPDG